MKILLDLGDLDTLADDDDVLSVIRNAVAGSHELEDGEILDIASVTAEVVESLSRKKPNRSFLTWLKPSGYTHLVPRRCARKNSFTFNDVALRL